MDIVGMDALDGGPCIDLRAVPLAEYVIITRGFCTLVAVLPAWMVSCWGADCCTGARVVVVAIESMSLKPVGVMIGRLLVTRGLGATL